MVDSIKITDGKAEVKHGDGVSISSGEVGKVVPLTHANDYTGKNVTTTTMKQGESSHEQRGADRVTLDNAGNPDLDEYGSIQDPQGNVCGNMAEVTGKHSMIVNGVRAEIQTLERLGMVVRDAKGEIIITGKDVTGKSEPKTPLSQTESLKTNVHEKDIAELYTRAGQSRVDAFMSHAINAIIEGTSAQSAVSDFSQSVGESEDKVHSWAETYINSLYDSGIDYCVRSSNGSLTGEQITNHLAKCSPQYHKSLLLSLHHNHLASAYELIKAVKEGKIL
jgi:hypothetical protein